MELQQLRNFICVGEYKSISRAAKVLLISQPALSRTMRALEEELGAQLLARTSHGIELTPQGEILLARGRELLALEDHIRHELRDCGNQERMPIRLVSRSMENLMPNVMNAFRKKYPDARFIILQNDDLAIQNHQYDLMISGNIPSNSARCSQPLLRERFLCALPKTHAFAEKGYLTPEEFLSLPQIRFGGHRQVQWVIQDRLIQHSLQVNADTICDDVRTGCNFVLSGYGVLLIPEFSPDTYYLQQIALLPIMGLDLSREIYLYWSANSYLPEYSQKFRSFLIKYFQASKQHQLARCGKAQTT